jgi:hypothetical protein
MKVWAVDNPNNFYNIYAKILPIQTELSGAEGKDLVINIVTGINDHD